MCAQWKKGYKPDHLAKRLDESKKARENGKLSFFGFGINEYIVVLNSMVSLNDTIPEFEKNNIVHHSAFSAVESQKITSINLLKEISKFEKQYLSQAPQKYILISRLSINRFCKLKRIKIHDCTITFHSQLASQFSREIEDKIKKPASNTIIGEYPTNYIFLKTFTSGKSFSQAVSKAIDSIDTIRGIWNLFYNRRKYRMSSGKKYPVNNIVFGPLHTIHFPNGKLASESWFYETGYLGPLEPFDMKNNLTKLYKFQYNARKLLNKSNFKSYIELALRKYTQALDLSDWESSYLRLWGLLEYLTNTNENESHIDTVNRTSFFFREREYAKLVLNHLRDHRNRSVHTGESNQSIETLMYQLKNFVEVVLQFQISNKFNFSSLDEFTRFMNLPSDSTELTKRKNILVNALKFING